MAPRLAGRSRAFVAKFSSDGKKLIWAVYLGGSGEDEARAIAIGASGSIYVAGRTTSMDFPVINAMQSTCRVDNARACQGDAFVAKLSATGELIYATYLGGSGDDSVNALALDSSENIYIAGETTSTDFPVLRAFQSTSAGGREGFLAKLSPDGQSLAYASYLGGSGDDAVRGIALDASGSVYLTGQSRSFDFPVQGSALQAVCRSMQNGQCAGSVFATKVAADGQSLTYSTYLGGSAEDAGNAIAVDSHGNAYITGSAQSRDFPLAQAMTASLSGNEHAFVSKLDAQGSVLVYSTLLGGSVADAGQAIAVDAAGHAHVAGWTRSLDFPVHNSVQNSCKLNPQGQCEGAAFASVLSTDGQSIAFSTYLGGRGGDRANAVSIDAQGGLRVAGTVASSDFPFTNSVQASAPNAGDAFLANLNTGLTPNVVSNCATAKQWSNAVGGDFNVAGNWTPSGVPGPADDACIPSTFAGVTVTFSTGTVIVNSFTAFSTFTLSGGSLTLATGGQLAGTNLTGGSLVTNGALLLNGATALTSGTLTGSGDITTSATFTWTGGTLAGTATPNAAFNAGAPIDFNGGNVNGSSHQLNQRTLNLPTGTTTMSGQSSNISLVSGAILHVPSGATLAFDHDNGLVNNQGLFNGGGSASTITNDGTIRKLAGNTGNTFFGVAVNFSATGHLEALSGFLQISTAGSSTGGAFLATSPGAFNFNSDFTYDAATSITGTGNYVFSGGNHTISGTYNVSGDTTVSGATLLFNSAPTINTVHLTSGTLSGSANLAPSGLFTWTGGVLQGTATPNAIFTISNAAGIDLNGGNVNGVGHQLNQRTLNLPTGTITMSGQSSSISLVSGAVLHVPVGATLAFDHDNGLVNNQGLFNGGGAVSTITIDGTIRKLAGNTGNTFFGVATNLSATGHLESLSGTMQISTAGSSTGGALLATSPGAFNFTSDFTYDAATSITGTGNYVFSGGNHTISGTYNVSGDTTVSGATLLFNSAPTINTVHLTSGTLSGSANLAPSGLFTWTGGVLQGTATPNAIFTISNAAGIDLNGGNVNGVGHQLNQRTLNLPTGTITMSGQSSSISLVSGAVLHVPVGATLAFDHDNGLVNNQGLFNGGGAVSTITIDGTIRKLAGNTGNTFFGVATNLSATGHLESLSGTMQISTAGSSTGGALLATSPGAFNFTSDFTYDAATSITGTGNYVFSGGNHTISGTYNVSGDTTVSGATLLFNSAPTINTVHLTSGTLSGSANLAPSGLFTWTGGVLQSTATPNATFTVSNAAGIDLNGGNANGSSHQLNQRTLNLPTGTTTMSGQSSNISLISGAILHVPSGATLAFDHDNGLFNNQGLFNGGGSASTITNDGTIRKLAGNTGNTFFGVAVNLSATGHFESLSGILQISTAGSSTGGAFLATSPGAFNFTSDFTYDAATSITGTGNYIFSGGTHTIFGTYNVSGDTTVSGATLLFNSTPTINTVHLTSGTLSGSANLAPSGLFTWTGGVLQGTATPNAIFTISNAAGIDLNGGNVNGSSHQLNQRTLNLPTGTVTMSGQSSSISLVSGAVLHVPVGATLAFDHDNGLVNNQGLFNGGGAVSTITIDGTIRKLAGNTGNTFFGVAVNLSATGHFESLSGILQISTAGSSTGGAFLATSPGAFNFTSDFTYDAATSITGTGNYIFSGGTHTIFGTYNVSGDTTVSGATLLFNSTPTINTVHLTSGTLSGSANLAPSGLFTWTGGVLQGTATPNAIFTISNAAGIDLNGGNVNGSSHQLNQRTLNLPTGTVTMSGQSSSISLVSGAVLHVPVGATLAFDHDNGLVNNQGLFNGGGAVSTITIDGTIRKLAGNTGNTFIGVQTNNTGTVEALSGILAMNGNLLQTAGITRANGGQIVGGTLTIQGGTLLGVDAGAQAAYAATVSNTGGIVHPGLSPGILTLNGTFAQSTGSFNVDINGTTAGTGFSQLNVTGTGTAALGGTLNVTLGGGFTPSAGNTFTVMTFTSHTGDFATFNAPALPGGLVWTKTVTATAVILTTNPPSVPDLTITKTHTGNFTQGQTGATYTITVANAGTGPSSGAVNVSDTLPTGLTATAITGTGWTCTLGNPTSTCNRSDVLANGSSYSAITLTVTVSGTAPASVTNSASVSGGGETNTGNDTASDTTTISSLPDLVLTIGDAPDPVIAGNNLTYTITVNNAGGSPASAATVADTLPGGVSLVSVSSSQGACAALPCNLGTINAASSAAVTVTVKVASSTRGTLSDSATVTETQTDANSANNTATATTTVNASADLSLTNAGAPSPVTAGTNLTYTIVATNAGPSTATNATVTDTLPAGTTFVSAGSTAGCSATGQTVTCPVGTLTVAGNSTATIVASVAPATRGALANTASVAATESDPNTANNSATANTTVNASADLAITKTATPNPVVLGNNVTFTITLTNNGPSTATSVTTTDTLPANISFVSATLSQGTCTLPPAATLVCNIGTVNPGASVTATVVVTPTATGTLTNSVSATGTENDPNTVNNTASASVTVNPATAADFTLSAAPSSITVTAGGTASYTLTLAPAGGFNKAVAVSCTVDTQPATCTATQSSVTLDGTHSATDTITVVTTSNAMAPPPPKAPLDPLNLLRLLLLGMTAVLLTLVTRAASKRRLGQALGFAAVALLVGTLCAGCSTGSGMKSKGTPIGAHQVTITGTSGSTTHNISVLLTVN